MSMKRIIVMSDNHGDEDILKYIKENEKADYYVHCGDSETNNIENLDGFICVSGNNDWYLDLPEECIFKVEDIRILVTHGHRFGYFNREMAMNDLLTRNNCQLLLCGHTHMPMWIQDSDYHYINPGSTSWPRGGSEPSYGILTIDKDQINFTLKILL